MPVSQPSQGTPASRSQKAAQQPDAPAHIGIESGGAQKRPGSQTLMNSHGSPSAPISPLASGAHVKTSLTGTHSSPSLQSGVSGLQYGKHRISTPSLVRLQNVLSSSHIGF